MKAIQITRFGDALVLQLADVGPVPKPAENQVLVRIHAAGVNFVDIYNRRGQPSRTLPFIPGQEASGVVEEAGPGVSEFLPGDRVCYTGHTGSYSEYTVIDAQKLIPLDPDFSFIQGAAFPLQGMTAHYLIHDYYEPEPGDTVLVHAAAGGVGLQLIQWAKHLGADVIGTVSSPEKARIASEAGADHVILYNSEDFAAETKRLTQNEGARIILDGVGRSTFNGDLEAVAVRGHIVIFGSSSGTPDPFVPNSLMPKSIRLAGGMLANSITTRDELLRRAYDVMDSVKIGWLKLHIGQVFPLAQASKAHELLESRRSTGKLILSVVPE